MSDIVYIYQAALYCEDCGRKICEELKAAGKAPAEPDDDRTFDSDSYPKSACDSGGESDSVEVCDKCGELLGNDLTTHGTEALQEMALENLSRKAEHVNVEFWTAVLDDYNYEGALRDVTLADLLSTRLKAIEAVKNGKDKTTD